MNNVTHQKKIRVKIGKGLSGIL